jgi:hypothetical protein
VAVVALVAIAPMPEVRCCRLQAELRTPLPLAAAAQEAHLLLEQAERHRYSVPYRPLAVVVAAQAEMARMADLVAAADLQAAT